MKKFTFILYILFIGLFVVSIQAQEVKIPMIISSRLGLGTDQKTTYYQGMDSLYSEDTIYFGSKIYIVDTTVTYDVGFTRFQPTVQASSATDDVKISFNFRPKNGYGFQLNRIIFDCVRYGTDGGLIDVEWTSDYFMESTTLVSRLKPARNNSGASTHTDSAYTTLPAYPFNSSLDFYLYSLGDTKQVGISRVILYGNIVPFVLEDTTGKAYTRITWPVPQSVIYGTGLGSEQLNAVATGNTSVPVYDPGLGTILPAGEHYLKVTFPADSLYGKNSASVLVQVLKGTSKITWEDPDPITEGTALSAEQLNATITGSTGAATYDPPLGTILSAGRHTLSVTYAPDDNYVESSKNVTIDVTPITSISGLSSKDIMIYPNPAKDVLNIQSENNEVYSIAIYNLNGTKLIEKTGLTGTTTIDISQLNNGMYFIMVNGTAHKLIVNN